MTASTNATEFSPENPEHVLHRSVVNDERGAVEMVVTVDGQTWTRRLAAHPAHAAIIDKRPAVAPSLSLLRRSRARGAGRPAARRVVRAASGGGSSGSDSPGRSPGDHRPPGSSAVGPLPRAPRRVCPLGSAPLAASTTCAAASGRPLAPALLRAITTTPEWEVPS